jgi:dUTP pyrophosphatase
VRIVSDAHAASVCRASAAALGLTATYPEMRLRMDRLRAVMEDLADYLEDDVSVRVKFKRLDPRAVEPRRMSDGAVGFDLCALDACELWPKNPPFMIATGIALEVPPGYECQVRLRSGMGRKGLAIPNAPGTIDPDYRGEIFVMLVNLSERMIRVEAGERVAQLVFVQIPRVSLEEAEELGSTARGDGGFGSTGR